MNFLVQQGKVRQQVINVPEGLPEILSDITREVLRCQPTPECLIQFIIDYMHSVLETREKAQMAKAIIDRALRLVDEIISDMCICDIPEKKADELAMAMEECFKRFLEKRRCDRRKEKEIVRFDEWDMLDELIQKCHFNEKDLAMSRPFIEEAYNRFVEAYKAAAETLEGTDALYEYFKAREMKRIQSARLNSAAIKIQAVLRGFLARKRLICDKLDEKLDETVFEYYLDEDKVHAAIKIQRYWRKHHDKMESKYDITYCEEEQLEERSSSEVCSPKTMSSEILSANAVHAAMAIEKKGMAQEVAKESAKKQDEAPPPKEDTAPADAPPAESEGEQAPPEEPAPPPAEEDKQVDEAENE